LTAQKEKMILKKSLKNSNFTFQLPNFENLNFYNTKTMTQFFHLLNDKKMKSMFFLAFLCAPSILFCQSETTNQPVKSKVETFTEETGTLIETTVEEIGTLRYSLSIKVLKLKNLITGVKINGISFELNNRKNILDADEIDGLVKSLSIMKDAAATTKPVYTELTYKSRTGFEVGAFFDLDKRAQNGTGEKKWMYYLKLSRGESATSLNPADFMAFCGYMEAAKNKL
jgi:hypothetical protein